MKNQNYFCACIGALALTALTPTINAAVVFEDNFDDDLGEWTTVSGFTGISIDTNNALGSGDSMSGDVSGSVNLLSAQFASQTLSAIGDSISLSFSYRWDGVSGATDRNPTFGLYSDNGTPSDYTDDLGYNAQIIIQTDPDSYRFYRDVNAGDNPLTGGGETQLGSSTSFNYDGTHRNFTMTLTRVADTNEDLTDDLSITLSVVDPNNSGNNVSSSVVDTSVATFTFSEFLLRSRSTDFFMDNVLVQTSAIPEPGTYALIGGCIALGIVMLRRRR
ncbi:MAG: PEP-CTERM sorting domain-containing protein [Puniceicoccales bacterium]